MLDSPLLDVSVRGFGEKMLGSPCRPLSSIFEDATQTTSLQSTLFFRYVTDFTLSLFRQTKLISCLQVALRFNFCISRFLRQINFTKLVNRPFHGFGRHLGWGANTAKFTVNVWEKSGVWRSIIRGRLTFCNFYELQT